MCTPIVAIRETGDGFMVQKGGIWWDVSTDSRTGPGVWFAYAHDRPLNDTSYSTGLTIMDAVDAVLAKVSRREDKGEGQ